MGILEVQSAFPRLLPRCRTNACGFCGLLRPAKWSASTPGAFRPPSPLLLVSFLARYRCFLRRVLCPLLGARSSTLKNQLARQEHRVSRRSSVRDFRSQVLHFFEWPSSSSDFVFRAIPWMSFQKRARFDFRWISRLPPFFLEPRCLAFYFATLS